MANYVVFGATGAIGMELSSKLLSQGHKVLGTGRDSEALSRLASLGVVAKAGATVSPEFYAQSIEQAVAQFGEVHGVVNAVGSVLLKPAHLTKLEEWNEVLRVNLSSAFFAVQASVSALSKVPGSSLVMFSSVAGHFGLPNHEAIAAAKAGVEGMVRAAAASLAPRGIRVNAVAPALVRSKMNAAFPEATWKASAAMIPLGRVGEPSDVVDAVAFLLDREQSGWMTGQVLAVDGGLGSLRALARSGA